MAMRPFKSQHMLMLITKRGPIHKVWLDKYIWGFKDSMSVRRKRSIIACRNKMISRLMLQGHKIKRDRDAYFLAE